MNHPMSHPVSHPKRSRARSAAAMLVLASTLVSGCVSLIPDPPAAPRVFTIAPVAAQAAPVRADMVLAVARPAAPRSLSGRDIVWRRGDEIAYIDQAAWDGSAPELLHGLLIDMLDRQAIARSIVRVADGVRADVELRWELVRFEIDETAGARDARIEMTVRLLDSSTRQVVADRRFAAHTPVRDRSASASAVALGAVARDAMTQTGQWLSDALAQRGQPSAASNSR